MTVARLLATLAAPLPPSGAEAPDLVHGLLVQRGDTELVALVPGEGREVRSRRRGHAISARRPCPRTAFSRCSPGCTRYARSIRPATSAGKCGTRAGAAATCCTPQLPGTSAMRTTSTRTTDRPRCPATASSSGPTSAKRTARRGSCWTRSTAACSAARRPAPSPPARSTPRTRMHLSIGEEGSPVLSGRWDGRLSVTKVDDELVALAVSPSGLLLAVDVTQETCRCTTRTARYWVSWTRRALSRREPRLLGPGGGVRRREHGHRRRRGQPPGPLLAPARPDTTRRSHLPVPVAGPPRSAGDRTRYTVSEDGASVHLWAL